MGKKSRAKRERRLMESDARIENKVSGINSDSAQVIATSLGLVSMLSPHGGACYRCAFFLRLFLKQRHGLDGEAVVGFVNDGSDDIYPSHAWYELRGQRTDLAISKPLHPEIQPAGPLTIHGIQYIPGHEWTYHRERPAAGIRAMTLLAASDPRIANLYSEQEEEHTLMYARSRSDKLMRSFLDLSPDGWTYDRTAAVIDQYIEQRVALPPMFR